MLTDQSDTSIDQLVEETWTPYCDEEYVATYIKLPHFLKVFRGKFQQIFGRRAYTISRFSMTVGELFIFVVGLAVMGLILYLNYGDDKPSGNAASIPLIGCLVFTVKNSLLGFLVGITYERGIFWHKIFGIVSVAGGILHMLSSDFNLTGWITLGAMFSMVAFSFWPIRVFFHAIFMKLHWIGFLVFIVGCLLHGITLGIIGAGYWAADFLVKLVIIDRHRKNQAEVEITKVSVDTIRLRVPNTKIPFSGGQFMFVCIPKISYFEWHPFSIQSTFKEGKIDLYVKAAGSWTLDLLAMVNEVAGQGQDKVGSSVKTKAYFSGPYGFPSIDIAGDQYQSFLLVGGGIGVTPIISTCKNLLEQRRRGRPVSKIILLWTTRDMTVAERLMSIGYLDSLLSEADKRDNLLEVCIHCSNSGGNDTENGSSLERSSCVKLITKRPDVDEYLKRIQSEAAKHSQKRAAVMVCGPHTLITSVQVKATSLSGGVATLDVHEEVFAM